MFKFLLIFLLFCVRNLSAITPGMMNIQGRLTDKYGVPLTGEFTVKFSIYDAPEAGKLIWQETQKTMLKKEYSKHS